MALDAAVASEYIRQSGQQQTLYAYWLAAGEPARARLAMDVANWYYQQLGIPLYQPTDFIGYVPNPTPPAAAPAIADSLSNGGLQAHYTNPFQGGSGPASLTDYCSWFPDDPLCDYYGITGFGGGGSGGNGPVYINQPVTIVINQQGLTLADVASKISGALATAAAAIATAVDTVLGVAIGGIQHALNAIGNQLVSVFHLLARLAGLMLQMLKTLVLGVVKGLVAAVRAIGEVLKNVIQHGLIPALQALQKLRDYLIKIYERFLRPLLIVLQDIRKVLAILRAFHIGFATKLDNVLADIQSKISTPLLYLLRGVNTVANYINLILSARLLIQKPLFLASLNAYKGSAIALQLNAINPKPNAAAVAALQASAATLDPAASVSAFHDFVQHGTGAYADQIAQQSELFKGYLQNGVQ